MTHAERIAYAKQNVLAGKTLDKASILQLLSISPDSPECEALGKAAREAASSITGDKACISGSIGVDYTPCEMNCDFCSLGKKWGIVQQQAQYSDEEILAIAAEYVQAGVQQIILRTTEFFSPDKLGALAKKIKQDVPGNYELVLNIGEFDLETANRLYEDGVDLIYHTLRLREGEHTRFDPAARLATMQAVKDSRLNLISWVEPIGAEHTNEEIADRILLACEYGAKKMGCMARVPVNGTPLGELPTISERRLAQVAAVVRLTCGASEVSAHPPCEQAVAWGCNSLFVEVGANPRDAEYVHDGKWKQFTADQAQNWFQHYGYSVNKDTCCKKG